MTYRQDSIILRVGGVALVVRGDRFELPQERFDELLPELVLRPNPHHVSGPPMSLWEKADVERAMETEAFKAHIAKRNAMREKRQAAAKKAVETKQKKLLEPLNLDVRKTEVPNACLVL